MQRFSAFVLVGLGLLASGCSDDGPDDPTDDSGGFWVVGDHGAVLDVEPEQETVEHTMESGANLRAITCNGAARAWYVGEAGAAAVTEDGGINWHALALDTTKTLRDVASTTPSRVAIAGDGGTLLLSTDGHEFTEVAGVQGDLTGVDLTPEGLVAVGGDGGIWHYETGQQFAAEVDRVGRQLHGVDFGDHTPIGAAVGADGLMLWTEDGGYTWTPIATKTSADLFAVQVKMDGTEAIAVGAAGTVVRVTGSQVSHTTIASVDLRAVHIDAWGRGAVVGDLGHVFHTSDAGREFYGETVSGENLRGVDALGERHW